MTDMDSSPETIEMTNTDQSDKGSTLNNAMSEDNTKTIAHQGSNTGTPVNTDSNNPESITNNTDVPEIKVIDAESQPNSRKVSFLTQDGSQGQFHHDGGHMAYLPVYVPYTPPGSRKSSTNSGGFVPDLARPPSRKTSMEAFYYPHPASRTSQHHGKISVFSLGNQLDLQHGKVSVISMGNSSDAGTLQADTLESLPCVDHYRDMVNVFDMRQRPTLYQLREDEKVTYLTIFKQLFMPV